MNLDELRTVQSKERQKDSLQHLRPSFYQEVGEYIADLEAERERIAAEADDPFSSPEVGRLTDEIETAKDVVEAIYERRMGKLVKQASLAAAGMPANDEGLTAEEADLFEGLVERIEGNKSRVLDVLEGKKSAPPESATDESSTAVDETAPSTDRSVTPSDEPVADHHGNPPSTDAHSDSPSSDERSDPAPHATESDASDSVSAADAMGGGLPSSDAASESSASAAEPSDSDPAPTPPPDEPLPEQSSDESRGESSEPSLESSGPASGSSDPSETEPHSNSSGEYSSGESTSVDRVTVRITRDIGSILGIDDREYTLATDDVVTLPEQNATPLVERDAAEPLE